MLKVSRVVVLLHTATFVVDIWCTEYGIGELHGYLGGLAGHGREAKNIAAFVTTNGIWGVVVWILVRFLSVFLCVLVGL